MKRISYFLSIGCLVLSWKAKGNFGEFFGSSSATSGLAGQTNYYANDPANNYYHPSLLGFANKVGVNFNTYYVEHDFDDISNVLIRNSQNSDSNLTGDIDTNYEGVLYGTIHAVLPIMKSSGNKVGISVFTPISELAEINTGDPFLTEYVMYRARYKRTVAYANLAIPINKRHAFSLGFYTGVQANSDIFLRASVGDPNFNTYARVKANARPSIAGILSYTFLAEPHTFSLTLQQEMESQLETTTVGNNSAPSVFLNFGLESLLYYDPYILRMSYGYNKKLFKFLATLEYQVWDQYKTPVVRINQNDSSTINSSKDFETIDIRSVFVPRLGFMYDWSDKLGSLLGIAYKPTPFESDFSGAGNSVDTDSIIYSAGLTYNFNLFGKRSEVSFSTQYHALMRQSITKSSGDELGSAGSKIGSPGYSIGGAVINSSVGLKMYF